MISWLKGLFTTATGEIIEKTGDAIDKLVTSDEERLKLKNELIEIQREFDLKAVELANEAERQITERWKSDNENGSWLAKNVRPLVVIVCVGAFVLMSFGSGLGWISIAPEFLPLWNSLLLTVIAAYFGARTIDKYTNKRK